MSSSPSSLNLAEVRSVAVLAMARLERIPTYHDSISGAVEWFPRTKMRLGCPRRSIDPLRTTFSSNLQRGTSIDVRPHKLNCVLASEKQPSPSPDALKREPHKYFDQVIITIRAGDGGHGAILRPPNSRAPSNSRGKQGKEKTNKRSSYKRDFDGAHILPMGGCGGDVIIYADEGVDSLLEFHRKSRLNAKRGGNVDAVRFLTSRLQNGINAPTLRIPVPLGTVVKHKQGKFLADLAHQGEEILVAKGGQGGISLLDMPGHGTKKMTALTTNILRDENDKVLVLGQPGAEVSLQLILRVVADVGLVGLPNAGKSTLLGAITLAKPAIADYPFTTLMPNLGRLDGDSSLGVGKFTSEATVADLPGLIEGAHLGKGLGRNFLRHLRRTRMLVYVVDAAAVNPVNDYRTVKEELRMYNPAYLDRPYIVVLNKIDIQEAMEKLPSMVQEISEIGSKSVPCQLDSHSGNATQPFPREMDGAGVISDANRKIKQIEEYPQPLAVLGASVLRGINIDELLKEIRAALRQCRDAEES